MCRARHDFGIQYQKRRRLTFRSRHGVGQRHVVYVSRHSLNELFGSHGSLAGTRIGIEGRILQNVGAVVRGFYSRLAGEGRRNRQ